MDVTQALDFARSRRNGVLVTQKREGRPQLSNISYAVIDGVVKDLDHCGPRQVRQPQA